MAIGSSARLLHLLLPKGSPRARRLRAWRDFECPHLVHVWSTSERKTRLIKDRDGHSVRCVHGVSRRTLGRVAIRDERPDSPATSRQGLPGPGRSRSLDVTRGRRDPLRGVTVGGSPPIRLEREEAVVRDDSRTTGTEGTEGNDGRPRDAHGRPRRSRHRLRASEAAATLTTRNRHSRYARFPRPAR
jgi:hypothetical protein